MYSCLSIAGLKKAFEKPLFSYMSPQKAVIQVQKHLCHTQFIILYK